MEPPSGSSGHDPAKGRRVNEHGQTQPSMASWKNIQGRDNSQLQNGHIYNHTYNGPVYHGSSVRASGPSEELGENHTKPREDLIETLSFDEMYDRYDTIDPVYSGTCQWFFDGAEYKAWHDSDKMRDHHGFLWIMGKPGTGKSTLMKDALLRGRSTFGKETDHATVSFFFDARVGDSSQLLQKSLRGLFRSLLYQLLKAQSHEAAGLESRRLTRAQQQDWPLKSLQGLFRDAVLSLGSRRLTCYVDALDECEESEARNMASFFEDLGASAVEKGVHFYVLFSSRHYPQIAMSCCQKLTLENQDGHAQDIERYIKSKLRIGSSETAQGLRATVQKKASGVFLWVILVISSLNTQSTGGKRLERLADHLEEMPDELDELFADILKRNSHDGPILLLTLQWLMFARRPMTRDELYCAIWYDTCFPEKEHIKPWSSTAVTAKEMNGFLINSSKGLVEVTKHNPPKVRFIHESVRNYLRNKGFQSLDSHVSENLVGRSHDRLKQTCQNYGIRCAGALLHSPTVGLRRHMPEGKDAKLLRSETSKDYPFLNYALKGMIHHADVSQGEGEAQDEYVFRFRHQDWARLRNLLTARATDRFSRTVSKDYILALNGAANLTGIWIRDNGIGHHCEEKYLSTLGAAVVSGNANVVQIVLDRGEDPNTLVPTRNLSSKNSLLSLAIHGGNEIMLRGLMDAGASVDFKGRDIKAAAVCDSAGPMSILLTHPSYSSPWPVHCTKALNRAIRLASHHLG